MNLAAQQLNLRFLDVSATIWSDDEAFINIFRQLYARFCVPTFTDFAERPCKSTLEFAYLTQSDNPWGKPLLLLDGQMWPLVPRAYAYTNILKRIFTRIRSHLLIHAGVVAWQDQGVLLVADTMHGKTTLVLELVRRGFKFFSDDVAALSRADGMIHPFPRALAIRAGTFDLLEERTNESARLADQAHSCFGKSVLDIERVQRAGLAKASPLRHLILLQNAERHVQERNRSYQFDMLLSHSNKAFMEAILSINGVKEVQQAQHNDYPLLRLHVSRPTVMSQIEQLCQAHDILVLNLIPNNARPSFKGPAQLAPISQSQAILALMAHFQGGLHGSLLQKEFGGRSSRLFMEVARLVGGAKCYQLSLGPLQDMAELVIKVVQRQRN